MRFKTCLFLLVFVVSCDNQEIKKNIDRGELSKLLLEANKAQVGYDTLRLISFIRLNQWEMKQTKSGLWYQIIEQENGPQINEGDVVTLDFTVHLLDGTLCYSTFKEGPKMFKVSRGGVESGLEEAILFLHGGDSARVIMPQFRAHHLLGDGVKIPPLATIIYHLRVLEVISPKGK
ncbi:MAG TPA: FKBP-type peptidyl-prolyl cis-trans isomerase [Salinivirgaceae bacterium]|nr:FKBP-type peptidyl-prolyl cis-trans isomerase [Salinivirgaceae bacterium]